MKVVERIAQEFNSTNTKINQRQKVFDSVAEMVANTSLVLGEKVRTLGYYSVGDGGGNDYEIVGVGTGTVDGGSFIGLTGITGQAKGLFGSVVNVKQFGVVGDGVADERSAFAAAFNNIAFTNFFIPNGQYNLTSNEVRITRGNIDITASPAAEFLLGTSDRYGIYFTGTGIDITKNITSISESIIIAPSHELEEMDYIKIVSNDYFSGLTDISGYRVRNKVEVVQVNRIIDSDTIEIVGGTTLFKYSPSATLTFSRLHFIENVSFTGGKIIGTGGFSGEYFSANRGIGLNYVINGVLDNIDSYNCTNQIIRITNSMFVNVTNCNFNGPDRALPDNSNNPTNRWTKGVEVHSANNITVQNCRGWNLRRIMDVESFSVSGIISNNCSQINCKSFYCTNVVANHTGINFAAINNYGEGGGGISLRSVNNTIIGNTVVLLHDSSRNGIRVGRNIELSNDDQEDAYNGNSVIKNNTIIGSVTSAFRFYGASDNIIIEGNTVAGEAEECFYMTGKRAKFVSIENNTVPIGNGGESIIGVQNGGLNNGPKLDEFGPLLVNNNNFKGTGDIRAFITLFGTVIGKGAGDIIATNNILGEIRAFLVTRYIFGSGYDRYGVTGLTSGETILKNNTIDSLINNHSSASLFINWGDTSNCSLKPITSDNICKNWNGSGVVADHVPSDLSKLLDMNVTSEGFLGFYTYTKGQIFWFSNPAENGPKGYLITKSGTSLYETLYNVIINASGTVGSDIISCDTYNVRRALNNYVLISGETYRVVEVLNEDRTSVRLDRPLHVSISGVTIQNSKAEFITL